MGVFEREAWNFILQDMPEGIVIAMFCFVFLNLRLRWGSIFVAAIVTSFVNMIEIVPLAFGVRTLVLFLAYMVVLRMLTKADLSRVILAVLVAFLLDGFSEVLFFVLILLPATGLSASHVYNTPYLRALFSCPTFLTILIATYLAYKYKKRKKVKFA